MSDEISYHENHASPAEITAHLVACDRDFIPPLSGRVNMASYVAKLSAHSRRIEAWAGGKLIGLVAFYHNTGGTAYVSNVSVIKAWRGRNISSILMRQCITEASRSHANEVSLEVGDTNTIAIDLYQQLGFKPAGRNGFFIVMTAKLESNHPNE